MKFEVADDNDEVFSLILSLKEEEEESKVLRIWLTMILAEWQ